MLEIYKYKLSNISCRIAVYIPMITDLTRILGQKFGRSKKGLLIPALVCSPKNIYIYIHICISYLEKLFH